MAGRATQRKDRRDAIDAYARELPSVSPPAPDLDGADDERRAAFSLQLNAINFGSGWFPTLNKPPGLSGFRTVEKGLRDRGPWTIAELKALTRAEIAETLGQDAEHPLMALFERSLRELGQRVGDSFEAFARSADRGGAGDRALPLADLVRHLALRRPGDPALQARPDRRRRPRPRRPRRTAATCTG